MCIRSFLLYVFRSIYYEPREFYLTIDELMKSEKGGVAIATGWKITKIDAINKKVTLDDGYEVKYDKCLIATGEFRRMCKSNISE